MPNSWPRTDYLVSFLSLSLSLQPSQLCGFSLPLSLSRPGSPRTLPGPMRSSPGSPPLRTGAVGWGPGRCAQIAWRAWTPPGLCPGCVGGWACVPWAWGCSVSPGSIPGTRARPPVLRRQAPHPRPTPLDPPEAPGVAHMAGGHAGVGGLPPRGGVCLGGGAGRGPWSPLAISPPLPSPPGAPHPAAPGVGASALAVGRGPRRGLSWWGHAKII